MGGCAEQCYRNRTETGKTGRSDRFTGLADLVSKKMEKNRIFVQTGYGTGRTDRSGLGTQETQFFFLKPENSIFNSLCDLWDEVLGVWLNWKIVVTYPSVVGASYEEMYLYRSFHCSSKVQYFKINFNACGLIQRDL